MAGATQAADASGREQRLLMEGVANIKEWGAVGDGVADDTAAVQAAIDAVTASACGGVVHVPAGTFCLGARLVVRPSRPFMLSGLAADISRLYWRGGATEGVTIEPTGAPEALANDAQVTVTGVSLLCGAEGGVDIKSSALLISGGNQLRDMPSGKHNLGCRSVPRVRVSNIALRGGWRFGLVLRSVMLADVSHVNASGVGGGKGSSAGVLMDGPGAPTGHTFENLRIFHFHTAILLKSDTERGRIEGVKVHACNLVAVDTGIRAESCLELSVVQNHINCATAGVVGVDVDQCFFLANLIYQHRGEGHGIYITGASKPATSHVICGNCIMGVQASSHLEGVCLDGSVAGAVVSGNVLNKQAVGVCRPPDAKGSLGAVCCEGNVCRGVGQGVQLPRAPHVHVWPAREGPETGSRQPAECCTIL